MVTLDEKTIIRALINGNKDAFTQLYNRHWNQVYNFCRLYMVTNHDAEEIVQDVFLKLWEVHATVREDDNLKGLLFIITRNLIFNKYRKNINEDFYKMTVLSAFNSSYNMEEEIEAKNLQEYIDILIEELPPRRKEIFILSRKQHKTYKEIAELLGISERTVENQISDALRYLKDNILLLVLFLSV